jgi:hypothetical protein
MSSSEAGHALSRVRSILSALIAGAAAVACQTTSMGPDLDAADPTPPKRMVTQGPATRIVAQNLTKCAHTNPKMNVRVAAVGEITATARHGDRHACGNGATERSGTAELRPL